MVTVSQATANPKEYLGRDLALDENFDVKIASNDDLQRITFESNLNQAITLRLKTAKGELGQHPEYGSRLHELLGTNANIETLQLVRMHIRDALLQEPRVDSITKISPKYSDSLNNVIDVNLIVVPINTNVPLNMVFSVFI